MLTFPLKSHRKFFTIPPYSAELAEFCGIMLGDGGISVYQTSVTLHANEREYHSFITDLMRRLFGVTPHYYRKKDCQAVTITLSRIGVAEFLTTVCELKRGNKTAQQVDVPSWIKGNTAFEIACMRGLFDTDGSVFTHRYFSKGRCYQYKKLSFTSSSLPLRLSVEKILSHAGIRTRVGSRCDVRIDRSTDVETYFRVFGSNNPKHLKRYAS